jgi:prephenate dehydrogenase
MTFGTVAILGPGLIGGSLALALAERGLADKLMIYARTDKSFSAIKAKLPQAELTTDVVKAITGADVVVLCVPIETMGSLVKQFADSLKPTALVTDVGSVKESVEKEIAPLLAGKALWIGSHPMAGSEQTGFSVARANLFEEAPVIVTPTELTPQGAEDRVVQFWKLLGAKVSELGPEDHDVTVAQISHLPHLIAAALVQITEPEARKFSAGGFRDTTRIASGSPNLWTEIIFGNRSAMISLLDVFISNISGLRNAIATENKTGLFNFLKEAQDARSQILEKKSSLNKSP